MRRTALRVMLACSLTLATAAVAAPNALADTASTQPATAVTATSAVLHGTVNGGSQNDVYEFQYGTTTAYKKATPLQPINTGGQNQGVSAQVKSLEPNTLYHFRTVLVSRAGTYYSYTVTNGPDQTFRTNTSGRLVLVSRNLIVRRGHLTAILKCASRLRCGGTYSVTTRARLAHTGRLVTILCTKPGSAKFNILAHKTRQVSAKATGGCQSLLRHARHQQMTGKFSSRPRTGQQGIITRVRLILV